MRTQRMHGSPMIDESLEPKRWGKLKEIKKTYPDLKVTMLSARCQERYVRTALNLGADGFIAKPFQPQGLIDRINHCLQTEKL